MDYTLFSTVDTAHKTLLDCKKTLQCIKDTWLGSDKKEKMETRKELISLLRKVSTIFNFNIQKEVDVKYKVAGLLLVADIYSYLGYIHADTLKSAFKVINEALIAIDSAKEIYKNLDLSEVDRKLIAQFNTFEIADPDDALKLIKRKLLPELYAAIESNPFFQIVVNENYQPQI